MITGAKHTHVRDLTTIVSLCCPSHLPKNNRNPNVFNDFGGLGKGPHHLPPPRKLLKLFGFADFGSWAGAPITCHLSQNFRNRHVFHDFGDWAGPSMTSHLPKKQWKSACFQRFWGWAGPGCPPPPRRPFSVIFTYLYIQIERIMILDASAPEVRRIMSSSCCYMSELKGVWVLGTSN